nr:hypothetical protein HmN_001004300 [Hymenolepis microstoma]
MEPARTQRRNVENYEQKYEFGVQPLLLREEAAPAGIDGSCQLKKPHLKGLKTSDFLKQDDGTLKLLEKGDRPNLARAGKSSA